MQQTTSIWIYSNDYPLKISFPQMAEALTGQVMMDNCICCHTQLNLEFVKTGRLSYMQQAIGLDMQKLNEKKQKFLYEIIPKWIDEAMKNGKLIEI